MASTGPSLRSVDVGETRTSCRSRRSSRWRRSPAATVQGNGHRLMPVLVPAQLFAVSGDEQQRIVGPAEDQAQSDARALGVDGDDVVLAEQVDSRLGTQQRDDARDEGQQATAQGFGRSRATARPRHCPRRGAACRPGPRHLGEVAETPPGPVDVHRQPVSSTVEIVAHLGDDTPSVSRPLYHRDRHEPESACPSRLEGSLTSPTWSSSPNAFASAWRPLGVFGGDSRSSLRRRPSEILVAVAERLLCAIAGRLRAVGNHADCCCPRQWRACSQGATRRHQCEPEDDRDHFVVFGS